MKTTVSCIFVGVLLVLSKVRAELERLPESPGNEETLEASSIENSTAPQKNLSTPKPLLGVHMIGVTDRRTNTGWLTFFLIFYHYAALY